MDDPKSLIYKLYIFPKKDFSTVAYYKFKYTWELCKASTKHQLVTS